MAPVSAAALLKTVKKPQKNRNSGHVWTTGVTVVIAMGVLALVGMEFTILSSHTSQKQAIMQKRVAVSKLKSLSLDDDTNRFMAPPRRSQPSTSFLKRQKGDELLPPMQHIPQMDELKQDSEDHWGGLEQQREEVEEEELEEEALEGMGVAPADKHEQVPLMTEPPIVQPNSGLHQQRSRAAAGAYSVVSHRERVPEAASESAFSFSGDLPGGDSVGEGAYRMPEPNDSKSRATDAVTRAKEKAAAIKARAINKGNRKFGQ